MKQIRVKSSCWALAIAMLAPAALWAQKDEKEVKGDKEKKEVQQIIVTRKGDKDEKLVIEVNGDKITVNGKSLDEYKDKNGDLNVKVNRLKDLDNLTYFRSPRGGTWNFSGDQNFDFFGTDENKAMLGVTTEKTEQGVEVQDVTRESAAAKAGLKEKDVITKVDDKKIEDPDDLSAAIKAHKPGDKVTITFLRDKKEQKVSAELTKWKGAGAWSIGPDGNFKMNLEGMNFDKVMPKVHVTPDVKVPMERYRFYTGGTPKLGLSVQDTDDGKGVKVIGVDDESNAEKAGIKEDDVITEVDGKSVNNADDMVKVIKDNKDKVSVMVKLLRNGKTQNIEVKMPRKLKSADL